MIQMPAGQQLGKPADTLGCWRCQDCVDDGLVQDQRIIVPHDQHRLPVAPRGDTFASDEHLPVQPFEPRAVAASCLSSASVLLH